MYEGKCCLLLLRCFFRSFLGSFLRLFVKSVEIYVWSHSRNFIEKFTVKPRGCTIWKLHFSIPIFQHWLWCSLVSWAHRVLHSKGNNNLNKIKSTKRMKQYDLVYALKMPWIHWSWKKCNQTSQFFVSFHFSFILYIFFFSLSLYFSDSRCSTSYGFSALNWQNICINM